MNDSSDMKYLTVTAEMVEEQIAEEVYFTADEPMKELFADDEMPPSLKTLTFCVLILHNGFTVTGESQCADPDLYDAEMGELVARRHAIAKIWPLLGYELRNHMAAAEDFNDFVADLEDEAEYIYESN